MSKATVFYNGSCPVCRTEIEHYRRLDRDADAALEWRDIAGPDGDAAPRGVDAEAMRRRLHVGNADGRLLVGVPAFARIWEHLPRYRWLAKVVRLPVARTLAAQLYEPVARGLYAWDRRRRRKRLEAPRETR
jgi:predicted DCC family thiol-disulfide oxidoreductase YuxK